jgi:hypothetical protein
MGELDDWTVATEWPSLVQPGSSQEKLVGPQSVRQPIALLLGIFRGGYAPVHSALTKAGFPSRSAERLFKVVCRVVGENLIGRKGQLTSADLKRIVREARQTAGDMEKLGSLLPHVLIRVSSGSRVDDSLQILMQGGEIWSVSSKLREIAKSLLKLGELKTPARRHRGRPNALSTAFALEWEKFARAETGKPHDALGAEMLRLFLGRKVSAASFSRLRRRAKASVADKNR